MSNKYLGTVLATLTTLGGLGTLTLLLTPISVVQAGFGNDNIACAYDRPCIDNLYQDGNSLVIHWNGQENYDSYNVRWSRPGKDEVQIKRPGGGSGDFRVNNVYSGTTYTFKVQGCNTHFLGRSTCSPWEQQSITAK